MKTINSLLTTLLLTATVLLTQQANAQAPPQKMSYQSVIRNSSNVLLANTQVGIRISVLQGNETGPAVYVETQTATTNGNGLLSIKIGTGTATTGTFAGINWANASYFIKTETDPAGGTNYSITGTQELLSVPYAMYAAKSGDATTMGAIGGSSTANGGTITAGVLSLTPANATNGGIVTTGAQIFAGNKTLTGTFGVGTTTITTSAVLEASSTTKGFLPPRMTAAQRNSITNPATGLVVFCTDCFNPSVGGELQVYSGGMWRNMIGSPAAVYPTVAATTAATSITATTATSGGNITSDGNGVISARGVCWSTSSNPTIANSKTTDAGTTGSYTSNLTGLSAATTYYVRAYATNAVGTVYGTQITFTTLPAIGDNYQGGKLAYILQPGDPGFDANVPHGLIAAPSDQSSGAQWGCQGIPFSGAIGAAIGTGNQNTIDIMAGCATAGIAARICGDLVLNGYSDWYLPSKDELFEILLNGIAIGGFTLNYYWSSTESGLSSAWRQSIINVPEQYTSKSAPNYVRAIRSF